MAYILRRVASMLVFVRSILLLLIVTYTIQGCSSDGINAQESMEGYQGSSSGCHNAYRHVEQEVERYQCLDIIIPACKNESGFVRGFEILIPIDTKGISDEAFLRALFKQTIAHLIFYGGGVKQVNTTSLERKGDQFVLVVSNPDDAEILLPYSGVQIYNAPRFVTLKQPRLRGPRTTCIDPSRRVA